MHIVDLLYDVAWFKAVVAMSSAVASTDLLGLALLKMDTLTWQDVERAQPPIEMGNFVGSRESSVDTVFGPNGEDANSYGFPSPINYVMNLTNIREGGAPMGGGCAKVASALEDNVGCGNPGLAHLNTTMVSDGLIGGHLPIAHFHFPVSQSSPFLPPGVNLTERRAWDMIAAGTTRR